MRLRLVGVLLVLAAFAPPALAIVLPARPAAGRWTVYGGGGFKVSSDRKTISGLFFKRPACLGGVASSGASISVLGTQKLSLTSRGGYTNWIIGRSTPKTSRGVTPINIQVRQQGKVSTATLDLIFGVGGVARDNSGDLNLSSGCLISFSAHR